MERRSFEVAVLHSRDDRLTHSGDIGDVRLPQASPDAHRSDDRSNLSVVHANRMTGAD
jgi:hypothetical protein